MLPEPVPAGLDTPADGPPADDTGAPPGEPGAPDRGGAGPARSGAPTRSAFADVVCADPEWLDREFAALIAANFPPSDAGVAARPLPPRRVVTGAVTDPAPERRPDATGPRSRPRGRRRGAPTVLARERSPPSRRATDVGRYVDRERGDRSSDPGFRTRPPATTASSGSWAAEFSAGPRRCPAG